MKRKLGSTTLPGASVSRQRPVSVCGGGGGGWLPPEEIQIHQILLVLSWNFNVFVKNVISFFFKPKLCEILIFR